MSNNTTPPRVAEVVRYIDSNPEATTATVLGRFLLDPRAHRPAVEDLLAMVAANSDAGADATADATGVVA